MRPQRIGIVLLVLLVLPRRIDVRKLCVLATDPAETRYYPARLFTGQQPAGVTSYVFLFEKGAQEIRVQKDRRHQPIDLPAAFSAW